MRKIISIIILLYLGIALKAQNNEITLMVNGDGQTKEAATASALRSAIEQAFGTFVSANTTILNDELVKDEIATVTSGNIKSYKEVLYIHNPDGTHSVTVSATVSIGNLISYAQSHGSSAEFAGQTFVMNIKMMELNKKNEALALQNMLKQLEKLQNDIFDFELTVDDPFLQANSEWRVPMTVKIKPNANFSIFTDIITKTFSSLSLSAEEIETYNKTNLPYSVFYLPGVGKYTFRNDVLEVVNWICRLLNTAQSAFKVRTVGDVKKIVMPWNPIVFVPDEEKFQITISYISPSYVTFYDNTQVGGSPIPLQSWGIIPSSPIELNMDFTMEQLSKIQSFEVIRIPVAEIGLMRITSLLDEIKCPYELIEGKNRLRIYYYSHKYSLFIDQDRYNVAYLSFLQDDGTYTYSKDEHIIYLSKSSSEGLVMKCVMSGSDGKPVYTCYELSKKGFAKYNYPHDGSYVPSDSREYETTELWMSGTHILGNSYHYFYQIVK